MSAVNPASTAVPAHSPQPQPMLHPLDQALPMALAGSGHSWFTRYRRYPVFSAPWVRGRTSVFAAVLVVSLLITAIASVVN